MAFVPTKIVNPSQTYTYDRRNFKPKNNLILEEFFNIENIPSTSHSNYTNDSNHNSNNNGLIYEGTSEK